MNKKNIYYCRLEIHKWKFFNISNSNIEESSMIFGERIPVYVENYQDYLSLKDRIFCLTENWFDCDLEDNQSDYSNLQKDYPSFLIYNRKNDWARISITPKGWLPPTTRFYGYVVRYYAKLYGPKHSEYSKYLNPIKGKSISFLGPEWDQWNSNEIELVSESLLNIFLHDFFNPGIINEEMLEQACHQEMVDRGYI